MKVDGRLTDKLVFTSIYLAVAFLMIWGAARIINYAVDAGFYRKFLLPWEIRLMEMRYKTIHWPQFRKDHPVAYMQEVVGLMKANGVPTPQSNTRHAFVYRISRFGDDAVQVLLVWQDNTIVIYGLPDATFKRLDTFIDGRVDAAKGNFTGRLGKDQITMIGSWKI